jgi:hypothetical protein
MGSIAESQHNDSIGNLSGLNLDVPVLHPGGSQSTPTQPNQAPLPPPTISVSVRYPSQNPIVRDLSHANNQPSEETMSLRHHRSPFEISMKESRASNVSIYLNESFSAFFFFLVCSLK